MSIEHVDALSSTFVSLFSTLRRDDLLPRDIGLEVVPGLPTQSEEASTTCQEFNRLYYPTTAKSLWHNLAFSLAISQDVGTTPSEGSLSDLALGVRTMVVGGRAASRLTAFIQKHEELNETIANAKPSTDQQESDLIEAYMLRERVRQWIADAEKGRVGWMWEVGTAVVLEVPEHRFGQRSVVREAIWVNPLFRFDGRPIAAAGLVRYMHEGRTDDQVGDVGGRFSIRYKGINYSIESLYRWRSKLLVPGDDKKNARTVFAVGYGLNGSTQVNLTFGKNYGVDFTNAGSLLASFGLTLALGSVPLSAAR